jgi:hypothetical protein
MLDHTRVTRGVYTLFSRHLIEVAETLIPLYYVPEADSYVPNPSVADWTLPAAFDKCFIWKENLCAAGSSDVVSGIPNATKNSGKLLTRHMNCHFRITGTLSDFRMTPQELNAREIFTV